MEQQDKIDKIRDLVLKIPTEQWKFNDYGNKNHSYCETELNGLTIKLAKRETPNGGYVRISVDHLDWNPGEKGIEKYDEIVKYHYISEEQRKLNEVDDIYNKLTKGDNSVTA